MGTKESTSDGWDRVMRRLQDAGFPIDPRRVAELTIIYLRKMTRE